MNVYERMEQENARESIENFKKALNWSYEDKVCHAATRVNDFLKHMGEHVHVSVGGLDSITLYLFINYSEHQLMEYFRRTWNEPTPGCRPVRYFPVHGISCSYLEDPSIIRVHHALGIEHLKPACDRSGKPYTKDRVISEFGFPVISKEIAAKIETLQNPTKKNVTVRHAIITGETGEYGGYQKNSRMKLAQKWLDLFGGYENETEDVNYGKPDFKVSSKCCYYLKEKPCDDWAKAHESFPFLGLMASEGGRRAKALMLHGCNYYGSTVRRSCPFAVFNRQDLLRLALEMDELYKKKLREQLFEEGVSEGRFSRSFKMPESIVPTIYGEIESNLLGELRTTKAQRTGCSMCGFGITLEKGPHRFDQLKERNPKEWNRLMYEICTDENGDKFGWAKVLDYIGVDYT